MILPWSLKVPSGVLKQYLCNGYESPVGSADFRQSNCFENEQATNKYVIYVIKCFQKSSFVSIHSSLNLWLGQPSYFGDSVLQLD